MRNLTLDPTPSDTLAALWERNQRLADGVEEALDWIEADPPDVRAKWCSVTTGMWVIGVRAGGEEWTVVWDEDVPDEPVVRLIAETTNI